MSPLGQEILAVLIGIGLAYVVVLCLTARAAIKADREIRELDEARRGER